MKRNVYLNMVPAQEAVQATIDALDRSELVKTEIIPSEQAAGRVLSGPVYACTSSPTFHGAAMDGIAVRADSTFAAREDSPVRLAPGRDFAWVNTGNPLPDFANAVIMIENVQQLDDGSVSIEAPAYPWQHVRKIGEDIVATELLYPQNRELSPYDVGALLSAGIWEVEVWERIRLHIIPTGDEVLDYTARPTPAPGQVIESNSQMMQAMATAWNCISTRIPPVKDKQEQLETAVREALDSEAHVIVIGAGSSAGSKDYTRMVMEKFGDVLVHGITVMPGKPSLLTIAEGKLIVGAPGYPVSAVVCFEELLAPVIAHLSRMYIPKRQTVSAQLTRKVPSRLGLEEIVRLAIGEVGDKYVATPLGRGAGMLTTLTKAQGCTRIAIDSEGSSQGDEVTCELYVPEEDLRNTLVAVGSHDNTLDLLANELMGLDIPLRLASTHVGSMGGLQALKNGSALLAGAHLFDPETGDFNFPFIEKYLPGVPVTVVNLAIRHQGLIVQKGNPQVISSIDDLKREDVTFVNRQRGAGTRILLDWHLKEAGIAPMEVAGYDREEFTHMAVAVNVLTGAVSCGLGIMAAATALDLDFVPLARERYDLLIPDFALKLPQIQALLELITSQEFKDKVDLQGGYETQLTGRIMNPGQGLKNLY